MGSEKSGNRNRPKVYTASVVVLLTPAEKEAIRRIAKKQGCKMSELLRLSALEIIKYEAENLDKEGTLL